MNLRPIINMAEIALLNPEIKTDGTMLILDSPAGEQQLPKKNKIGRPKEFDRVKRDAYLQQLRNGCGREQAAYNIGTNPQRVIEYRREHPEFSDDISLAEVTAANVVENALFMKCKEGNITAIIFYLTNRLPDRWKDRRNNVTYIKDTPDVSTEELKKLLKDRGFEDATTIEAA